jgi:hypothetical protein
MINYRLRPFASLVILLLIAATTTETQSGKASGTLVVNGKKVPIQHAYAVTYDTPNLGRVVSVLLSDKPMNPKMFQEYTRIGPGERYVPGLISGAWVTMHVDDKAFSGFHFTIKDKSQATLGEVLIGSRDDNFGVLDEVLVFEGKSLTPQLVGRIRTKDAVADLGSTKVGIDLTFDVPVVTIGK